MDSNALVPEGLTEKVAFKLINNYNRLSVAMTRKFKPLVAKLYKSSNASTEKIEKKAKNLA